MENVISKEDFLLFVKEFNLSCEYSISEMDNKNLIVETWTSKSNPFIRLNRAYEFTPENIKDISPKNKKKILSKMMDRAVEIENYEFAAQLRDYIKENT